VPQVAGEALDQLDEVAVGDRLTLFDSAVRIGQPDRVGSVDVDVFDVRQVGVVLQPAQAEHGIEHGTCQALLECRSRGVPAAGLLGYPCSDALGDAVGCERLPMLAREPVSAGGLGGGEQLGGCVPKRSHHLPVGKPRPVQAGSTGRWPTDRFPVIGRPALRTVSPGQGGQVSGS